MVPTNSRVASQDTILPLGGGADGRSPIFISAGTVVALHVHALHRRVDLWGEDANEFRPERWEREKDERGPWVWTISNEFPFVPLPVTKTHFL